MTSPSGGKGTNKRLWGEITFDDWCAALGRLLSTSDGEPVPGGTVWMINGGENNTIGGLLSELAEKAGYEDPWGEADYDEAMQFVREHFMQDDHAAVLCEVTSHMTSGAWGLGQFISGDRGYFYRKADFGVGDDEGEAIPILSAWAPASDPQVYESAFVKTYEKHWGFGLPPDLGEWADGPPKLMTKAISRVLTTESGMWKTVIEKLTKPESAIRNEDLAICIAQQTAVPAEHISEVRSLLGKGSAVVLGELAGGEVPESVRQGLVALFWYALLTPGKRQLWETYPNTILEFSGVQQLAIDLRRPILSDSQRALKAIGFAKSFAVLTACNPLERPASDEDNKRWTDELEKELRALGIRVTKADGVSPDGKHREAGYALGIPMETAKALARKYGQAAFFWFDGEHFWIVPALVQADPIRLPLPS